MTDNARNDAPAVTEKKSSRRSFRRKKPWHQGRGGSTQNGQSNKQGKPQPKIFFCGDPHGEFDYINKTVEKYRPDAIVILGDLQPPDDLETLLAPTLAITQVWWIPGNHDTDCEEYYDRLWHGPIAEHNLHGRVAEVAGLRIAGLGGVFRGQIWMPEGRPNYQSATGFVRRSPKTNLWRGGLPRRHRSSIFPATYEALQQCKADILVTHEAAGCHKKGFDAIDRLAKSLGVTWLFHGHQHEDCEYGVYKGMQVRAVGFRGIVDLNGRVVRPAEIDPRDILVMQQAGEEPSPDELDSIPFDFQEMLDRLRARDNGCGSLFVNNSKRSSRYFNRNGRSRFLKEHRAEVVDEKKNKSKD